MSDSDWETSLLGRERCALTLRSIRTTRYVWKRRHATLDPRQLQRFAAHTARARTMLGNKC